MVIFNPLAPQETDCKYYTLALSRNVCVKIESACFGKVEYAKIKITTVTLPPPLGQSGSLIPIKPLLQKMARGRFTAKVKVGD